MFSSGSRTLAVLLQNLFPKVEDFEPNQLELDATLVMQRKPESSLTFKSATFIDPGVSAAS